ncbi:MAG TPA: hypothetical protein VE871_08955 [Longimicrobium sp.]|nr:hypothetical protein [Longimicrobium sp.]
MSRAALRFLPLIAILCTAVPAGGQDGPVLRGRVVAADGAPVRGMRAVARWQRRADAQPRADSATVDAEGRFRIVLPAGLPDSLTVVVDVADGAPRTHHPSLVRLARGEADREHGFILAPRVWIIGDGFYAGQRVEISPTLARRPACAGCSTFWVRMPGTPGVGFQGWPGPRFPLRVAFERGGSQPMGAAPDSAAFWRAAAGVENALGRDLFRAVPYAQTLSTFRNEDPVDVVLVRIDRSLTTAGLTTMVGTRGSIEYAGLALQRASAALAPGGRELVAHELMHVLGLGHTCAWRSVLAESNRCPGLRASAPTPEDVAYTQLLYRVRDLQRDGSMRWGLDAAVEGERMLDLRDGTELAGTADPGIAPE